MPSATSAVDDSVRAVSSNLNPVGSAVPSDCVSVYTNVPVPPDADDNCSGPFTNSAVQY